MTKNKQKITYLLSLLFMVLGHSIQASFENTDIDIISKYSSFESVMFILKDGDDIQDDNKEDNNVSLECTEAKDEKMSTNAPSTLAKQQPDEKVLQKWFEAAKNGKSALLTALCNGYSINVHAKNKDGDTALHLSSHQGDLDCVKYLVEQGANKSEKNNCNETALIESAYEGHLEIVKYLVAQGANIHATDNNGNTALLWSAYWVHLDIIKYLVEQGANIHTKNKNGNTALTFLNKEQQASLLSQAQQQKKQSTESCVIM